MELAVFTLLAFSSLFMIVDPIGLVPVFLAITPTDSPSQRTRMARLACLLAGCCLVAFALAGKFIFRLLGIGMSAFQMAGSLVLLLIALDMLRAERGKVHETEEETSAGAAKADIAVTPLAVPMLAGPGAITAVILLESRAVGLLQKAAVLVVIVTVLLTSYLILHLSAHGARWLKPIAMKVITRIMGLLLAAIGFQFLLDALRSEGLIRGGG